MGAVGVLAFSGTLPATRLAVPFLGPVLVTFGRVEVAAALAILTLALTGSTQVPARRHWIGLLCMGCGLAVGYPLFVALAMRQVPAVHGAVVIGLAPLATALIAVVRTNERPPATFWLASLVGVGPILAFAVQQGGGELRLADAWLALAMVSVGVAYVEGGRASQALGGTTALCWAMIAIAPASAVPLGFALWQHKWGAAANPPVAWAAFGYAAVFSMFLGSIAWYRGLAAGGIARIGQLNQIQPFLALLWSHLLLGEVVTGFTGICAFVIAGAMTVCVRTRVVAQKPARGLLDLRGRTR